MDAYGLIMGARCDGTNYSNKLPLRLCHYVNWRRSLPATITPDAIMDLLYSDGIEAKKDNPDPRLNPALEGTL